MSIVNRDFASVFAAAWSEYDSVANNAGMTLHHDDDIILTLVMSF